MRSEPAASAREPGIRTRPRRECYACGEAGERLYSDLRDRLFGAPGRWSLRRCPDPGCGLLWLDPAPLPEDIAAAYARYYTHGGQEPDADTPRRRWYRDVVGGYLARRFGYDTAPDSAAKRLLGRALSLHPGRRADADFSVLYLPALRGGRLLDVGCGDGRFLARMRDLGWEVEGVDFDPAAAARARERGLEVRGGTLEEAAYPDGRFDAVTLSHVVEHVFDPRALLSECRRVLAPGGRLVVVTPNARSWGHRLHGRHWRGLEPPRHIHVFTPEALVRLARKAGFGSVTATTTVRDANGMLQAGRSLSRGEPVRPGREASFGLRMWGRTMQWIEWLVLRWRPERGEEIALRARR